FTELLALSLSCLENVSSSSLSGVLFRCLRWQLAGLDYRHLAVVGRRNGRVPVAGGRRLQHAIARLEAGGKVVGLTIGLGLRPRAVLLLRSVLVRFDL